MLVILLHRRIKTILIKQEALQEAVNSGNVEEIKNKSEIVTNDCIN